MCFISKLTLELILALRAILIPTVKSENLLNTFNEFQVIFTALINLSFRNLIEIQTQNPSAYILTRSILATNNA
jgi:hypothetical protein